MTYEALNQEMIKAMKEYNNKKKDAIRSVINNIKNACIDRKCEKTDSLVDEMLLKEVKIIKEQIETCPSDRTDLLEDFNYKLEVINKYAPKIITDEDEIEEYINYIVDNYEVDISNMGMAMKTIMPHLKGKCDMKIASSVIRGMGF